jgi:glycosyltransferase involved in cell wall biosynthesis
MRVVYYWDRGGLSLKHSNPYGGLFARAMADLGVEVIAGFARDLNDDWLIENRQRVDLLHFHWPHYMYDSSDLADHVSRCADRIGQLARARLLGYKIVWTVHNLYPHSSHNLDLDRLARLAITHLAAALIVHCQRARDLVKQHFFRQDGVFIIPHGSFIDAYPNTVNRAQARQRLGLSEECFVYLFFGAILPYKGLEHLLEAFTAMEGENLTLLLAARVYNEYSAAMVEQAKQADPRIVVVTSDYFPAEDLQLYFNATDVVVMPFLDMLTSGSVITALSFSRPVIVPAIGCLPELVDDSIGAIYDPHEPDALAHAMRAIQQYDLTTYGSAAYRRAESLSWDTIARQSLEAYRYPC